MHKLGVVVP